MRGQHASAMEHLIPERIFANGKSIEGVSAVKAITKASQAGQKIYTISQANAQTALGLISHSADVMNDIRSAVAGGKEVTVSEKPVDIGGWTGTGYIIVDPDTGGGAYLIQGSANGGIILVFLLIAFIAIAPIVLMGASALTILGAGFAINQAINFADKMERLAGLSPQDAWKEINGYLFLLVLESLAVLFVGLMQAASLGIELFKWSAWDFAVVLGLFSVLDAAWGVGS